MRAPPRIFAKPAGLCINMQASGDDAALAEIGLDCGVLFEGEGAAGRCWAELCAFEGAQAIVELLQVAAIVRALAAHPWW